MSLRGASGSDARIAARGRIGAQIVFVFVVLGAAVWIEFRMHKAVGALDQALYLNSQQIVAWQTLQNHSRHLIQVSEQSTIPGPEVDQFRSGLASRIAEIERVERDVSARLDRFNSFCWLYRLMVDIACPVRLSAVPAGLVASAKALRDAPFTEAQRPFAVASLAVKVDALSRRALDLLFARDRRLGEMKHRYVDVLHYGGPVVSIVAVLGVVALWLGIFRPTARRLKELDSELQFVLDNAPAYIFSFDRQGHFLSATRGYLELIGADSVQVVKDQHIADYIGVENWKRIESRIGLMADGAATQFDAKLSLRGVDRVLLGSYRPKLGNDGKVVAVVAVILDITERSKMEQALRQSEQNMRSLLDSISEAVVATDGKNRIVQINPEACRLTGWSEADALGRAIDEVMVIERCDHCAAPSCKSGGWPNTQCMRSRTGDRRVISESTAPLRASGGDTVGTVRAFRDVTEEDRLLRQLAQSEKLRSIGLLAGGIAHDFNNLLAGIQAAVDLLRLRLGEVSANVDQHLQQISTAVRRGAKLTEQLVMFARKQTNVLRPVDVSVLIEECFTLLRKVTDRRIEFELDHQADSAFVHGNESALQSVFFNLMLNAVEAMAHGGTVRVTLSQADPSHADPSDAISTRPMDARLCVTVHDTGSGIATEDLDRVFDPFFTTKGREGHTGLGLSAAYGTIMEHKGSITAANNADQGALFTVVLPSCDLAPAVTAGSSAVTQMQAADGAPVAVLLAEDEDYFRDAVRSLLESNNHRVLVASDGQACIDLFREHRSEIGVLVLDMNMPIKNGAEVLSELDGLLDRCWVIVSTGYSTDVDTVRLTNDRIARVIEKPYTLPELAAIIESLMPDAPVERDNGHE